LKRERITSVVSSPLGRARATASYTERELGLHATIEDWMAELSSLWVDVKPWGPLAGWDVPGEVIRRRRCEPGTTWHGEVPFDLPAFAEASERVARGSDAFLARIGYRRDGHCYVAERPHRERIAVFCHGGLGLTWLSHLLDLPTPHVWAGFFLPPSSVTTILFDERTKGRATPRVIGMGDVSHLYVAGLPTQPAGIKANFD
jgi:probable phosphoglycerate mutase